MKVRFTSSARTQFLSALTYIRRDSPVAALNFRERAETVSLSAGSMADFDPCMTCLEQGLCPHCGEELAEDGMYLVCEKCGWTEETEEGIPEEPECICPEEGYEAMFPDFTTRGERL